MPALCWRGRRPDGEAAGRRRFPWAVAAGVGFFAASQWLGGDFLIFVIYEGAAMPLALAISVRVAMRGEVWAWWTASGIGVTLVAATVQATSLRMKLVVPFDHNGLFPLVHDGSHRADCRRRPRRATRAAGLTFATACSAVRSAACPS